jgi:hypothetical protein
MTGKFKNVDGMTYEELVAERDELAAERTRVRLRQNEVAEAIEVYEALKNLSPAARKRITIGGSVGSDGGIN